MPRESKATTGRPPKPAAIRRSDWIRLRVSPVEKAAAEARAQAAGLELSEYGRLQICGAAPENRIGTESRGQAVRHPKAAPAKAAPGSDPAFEELVRKNLRTMPRRSAEISARRELRRRAA